MSVSHKSLWTLVSGASIHTERDVIKSELSAQQDALFEGLLGFKPNTKETAELFKKKSSISENLREFVVKLSKVIGVGESQSWELLCQYLASEFRGTSESLKDLLKHDQQVKPLILDIWQFYRAERLYLLQVLKEVLSYYNSSDHKNSEVFASIIDKVDAKGRLKKQLLDQFAQVIKEKCPLTESLGSFLASSCRSSWMHFNLREQSELLQIILVYLHQRQSQTLDDFVRLCEIFQDHGYGTRQSYRDDLDDSSQVLVSSIGWLEGSVLVYLLDLPGVTLGPETHYMWSDPASSATVERIVSGLGNLTVHAPPMLAWTLGCYLAKGGEGVSKAARVGEAAIANRVLETLRNCLAADFTSHTLVSDILHSTVYTVLSALVSAFDPSSMGLSLEVHTLAIQLLKHPAVSSHFFKQGKAGGLGLHFEELKKNFPCDHDPLIEACISLASSSEDSCDKVISRLSEMEVFTEYLDEVPPDQTKGLDGEFELITYRFPYPGTETVFIPAGTRGEICGQFVRWRHCHSGWQVLLAEVGSLVAQVTSGAGGVNASSVTRVTAIARLVAAVLKTNPSLGPKLAQMTEVLVGLVSKFCLVAAPPLQLLAAVTDSCASLAVKDPGRVMERLAATHLLPKCHPGDPNQLQPGVIGALLAGQETVSGEYPLLLSFLRLMSVCGHLPAARPSITFILREVLPNYSIWRYDQPGQREQVVRLGLEAVGRLLPGDAVFLAGEPGLGRCLLGLAATGDRPIQTLLEGQSSWDKGRGSDMAVLVKSALDLLHKLLISPASSLILSGPVGQAIRAPPAGAVPHFLLILSHYVYFFHEPELAISAVDLLSSIADDSVSVLACLAGAAPAVRDMFLARLEAATEDIRLKISIVKFLLACVDRQPGMVQLLLDINTEVTVVEARKRQAGVTGGEKEKEKVSSAPKLVGVGCLAPVLQLLSKCKEETGPHWLELHLSIVRLIHSLWSQCRLLATTHLKKQKNFWPDLCWPLTDPLETEDERHLKVKAYALRIVSHEVYTWKGNVGSGLTVVLEKICDPKRLGWCDNIQDDGDMEDTVADDSDSDNVPLFLLSSWRAFLLVLSKDSPVTVSPAACRAAFSATAKRLMSSLEQDPPPPRLTVLLAETASVLARRWQTKVTDDMPAWCDDASGMLERLAQSWDSLHPRARLAILGIGMATLRMSQFKLEQGQEETVLARWLEPVISLVGMSLREVEIQLGGGGGDLQLQAPELTITLLHALIDRFTTSSLWMTALHREAALCLLLAAVRGCCRSRAAPTLVTNLLRLISGVAASPSGTAALLLQELSRDLWMPLSDLPPGPPWADVRRAGLELAGTLVRVGRRPAVGNGVTAAALLSDKLAVDLLSPRQDLANLPAATAASRFIASLSSHADAWRTDHPTSLVTVYRATCRLLHTATALLMRPGLLSAMAKKDGNSMTQVEARTRRVSSSTTCSDEVEYVGPEAAPAHASLLDLTCSCLSLLSALSPPLPALLAGDALLDPEKWEPLLAVSFSGPTLEQDGDIVSYGTLIALANLCVRSISRDTRSPSPGRAASASSPRPAQTATPLDTPERKKLTMVMEKSLTILLSQSILCLADPHLQLREKQLLRRELGAELGSITDSWRRYLLRGAKSPGPVRGSRSPGPPASGGTSPQPPRASKSDEQFMKLISSLVQSVFK